MDRYGYPGHGCCAHKVRKSRTGVGFLWAVAIVKSSGAWGEWLWLPVFRRLRIVDEFDLSVGELDCDRQNSGHTPQQELPKSSALRDSHHSLSDERVEPGLSTLGFLGFGVLRYRSVLAFNAEGITTRRCRVHAELELVRRAEGVRKARRE